MSDPIVLFEDRIRVVQHQAEWENPIYAGSTCKARREGELLVISIGRHDFRVEPETARKLAEQINALLVT
jgi:hypothetical protein